MTAAETRAANRVQSVKDAISFALANGWDRNTASPNSLRRKVEHPTPERVQRAGWWRGETYASLEFVDFLVFDGGAVIIAFHKTTRCPWIARSDRKVSVKRALEILNDPALSDVHTNH